MIASAREKVQEMLGGLKIRLPSLNKRFLWFFLKGIIFGLMALVFLSYAVFRFFYLGKVFPGVLVSGIDLSGMTVSEAVYEVDKRLESYLDENPSLMLVSESSNWSISLKQLDLSLENVELANTLFKVGRTGPFLSQLSDQAKLFKKNKNLMAPMVLDEILLDEFVSTASAEVSNPPIPPRVYLDDYYNPKTNSRVVVESGESGTLVDLAATKKEINNFLSQFQKPVVNLEINDHEIQATGEQLVEAEKRAKKLLSKTLTIKYSNPESKEGREWVLSDKDLISFISVVEPYNDEAINSYVMLVSEVINREPQNATFQFDDSNNKVVAFRPARDGLKVQSDKLRLSVVEGIEKILESDKNVQIDVSVYKTDPNITTSEVNDLGIDTLLGKGESTYYHSSTSRKHNVELAAAKLNGVLVAPGEEFSFNKALGEVSTSTGFRQALIIKEGETILDDGGGVCQDSTTLFRAMLDAGLPITMWQNHSFRVSYYEQNSKPGFDATVFIPLPDLRFINDTPNYLLIQTKASNMNLTYEIYGTDDGRQSKISNYSQWDASPPPPDLYKDDPTLPVGEVKKVESAVPGLKAKFDYSVEKDGEIIFEKTFYSIYQPWQAVYLRGTGG